MNKAGNKYVDATVARVRASFAHHVILDRGPDYWICGRSGDSTYRFEVRSMLFGALYVGGDIDHMLFADYSDSPDPERKLRWIGAHTDVGYYVAQKASIGMQGLSCVWGYDRHTAAEQLCEMLGQDDLSPQQRRALTEVLAQAPASYEQEDVMAVLRESEAFDTFELPMHLGVVPSARLIIAWQAAKKVVELLDAERGLGQKGTP